MPRPTKPMKRRNTKRRPVAAKSEQRAVVLERDGYRCAFEVSATTWYYDDELMGHGWMRCLNRSHLQSCHVVRVAQCGDAYADRDVAIAGCKRCHDVVDHRAPPLMWDTVRFPEAAVARAVAAVKRAEAARAAAGKAVVKLKGHHGK